MTENDTKTNYLQGLMRMDINKLSLEDEHALGHGVARGDSVALEKLIRHNLRLVPYMVSTKLTAWRNGNVPMADLIQMGNEALVLAAQRWKPREGVRFSSYACPFIYKHVSRELNNTTNAIRLPVNIMLAIKKMHYTERVLSQDLGRKPTVEELAETLGTNIKKVHQLKNYINREPISLESLESENHQEEIDE